MTRLTYRYLENQLRFGPLGLGQWVQALFGVGLLALFVWVVGMPIKPAISLGVFLIGIPTALAAASDEFDFSIWQRLRDAFTWRSGKRTYSADAEPSTPTLIVED